MRLYKIKILAHRRWEADGWSYYLQQSHRSRSGIAAGNVIKSLVYIYAQQLKFIDFKSPNMQELPLQLTECVMCSCRSTRTMCTLQTVSSTRLKRFCMRWVLSTSTMWSWPPSTLPPRVTQESEYPLHWAHTLSSWDISGKKMNVQNYNFTLQ